jgi:hypothetical protein
VLRLAGRNRAGRIHEIRLERIGQEIFVRDGDEVGAIGSAASGERERCRRAIVGHFALHEDALPRAAYRDVETASDGSDRGVVDLRVRRADDRLSVFVLIVCSSG